MNIALSAIVIFILLLPPITFYVSFTYGRFHRSKPQWNSPEVLMTSALFAMIIHVAGALLMYKNISFDTLILLLSGNAATVAEKSSNKDLHGYLLDFCLYCTIQLLIAFTMGRLFRWYLRKSDMHSKSEILRIYNQWWYLFNAYKASIHTDKKSKKIFDLVVIDVLVNTNSGSVLYSGYLEDFTCDGENLERLHLSDPMKRAFKTAQSPFKEDMTLSSSGPVNVINGELLVIPAREIININLNFIDLAPYLSDINRLISPRI